MTEKLSADFSRRIFLELEKIFGTVEAVPSEIKGSSTFCWIFNNRHHKGQRYRIYRHQPTEANGMGSFRTNSRTNRFSGYKRLG